MFFIRLFPFTTARVRVLFAFIGVFTRTIFHFDWFVRLRQRFESVQFAFLLSIEEKMETNVRSGNDLFLQFENFDQRGQDTVVVSDVALSNADHFGNQFVLVAIFPGSDHRLFDFLLFARTFSHFDRLERVRPRFESGQIALLLPVDEKLEAQVRAFENLFLQLKCLDHRRQKAVALANVALSGDDDLRDQILFFGHLPVRHDDLFILLIFAESNSSLRWVSR